MTVCGGHLTAGETASQIFSHAKVSGAIHRGGWDNQNLNKYFFSYFRPFLDYHFVKEYFYGHFHDILDFWRSKKP